MAVKTSRYPSRRDLKQTADTLLLACNQDIELQISFNKLVSDLEESLNNKELRKLQNRIWKERFVTVIHYFASRKQSRSKKNAKNKMDKL